jgi:hypothetical protein
MSTPEPVPPLTLDQVLAALDAHEKAKESKIGLWIKTNWHHVVGHAVTWVGVATGLARLFGKL